MNIQTWLDNQTKKIVNKNKNRHEISKIVKIQETKNQLIKIEIDIVKIQDWSPNFILIEEKKRR